MMSNGVVCMHAKCAIYDCLFGCILILSECIALQLHVM